LKLKKYNIIYIKGNSLFVSLKVIKATIGTIFDEIEKERIEPHEICYILEGNTSIIPFDYRRLK
jgi:hypothetical protein